MKLPKVYEPGQYEKTIYELWEKSGVFQAQKGSAKDSYSIVIPPPNANGDLHIGHALTLALEDIAIRYQRLKGKQVLFLPGADHAGFETQVVYEKRLAKEGKSRFDYTRDELYQQIWDFVAKNRENYQTQFRRLGASLDWSRFTFTLDEKIVKQAHATFKKMWDEGLIYRGERLVNFCTFHGTAFADIEVEHKEEAGHLWYIRYPLTDGSGEVVVATTRPETMLGDVAVAVHPDDERYQKFIGKTVKLPLTHREIPVLADEMVDKEFGTGAVKITPAHDQNDYEVAERHDLPKITVISHEGKITDEAPDTYRGMSVDDARAKAVDELKAADLLVMTKDHIHNVGHCYKCSTVIQPLLREQWFVDMQPLAKEAITALKSNKITFYPDSKREQLIRYLEGLRDWNISRQIAWGIPIPAFQNIDNLDEWIFDERADQETLTIDGKTYRRDPDVFDTWFSSSSWPYATLNFPEGDDFKQFYPLSLMETGGEIMNPWVSRMIMLGLYVTGKVPFEAVYIHGYVMAEDGSKMSKSVGNVVDPMPVVDQYGSDALRMGIVASRAPAVNRGYDQSKIEGGRNFANKLWNVARFIEDKVGDNFNPSAPKAATSADEWMLSILHQTTQAVSSDLENYRFAEAYEKIYHLLWDGFADWYIELSKVEANHDMLAFGLDTILKLAHPFAPFVTETIWQTIAWTGDSILAGSQWPEVPNGNTKKAQVFEEVKTIVTEVRHIKATLNFADGNLYYTDVPFLRDNADLITKLTRLEGVVEVKSGHGLHLTTTSYTCWLDVDQDTARRYLTKLQTKRAEQEKSIANLEARLGNKSYVKNAPDHLIKQTKDQLVESKKLLSNLTQEYERFDI